MPELPISVGVITNANGAHLSAYFAALAAIEEAGGVVLCDPGGKNVAAARKALGEKLTAVYEDVDRMLMAAKPDLAMVSVEAVKAPPLIEAALDAGCHVFAEKPACVDNEDFRPLANKARAADQHLMLALANRVNPAVKAAHKLIHEDGVIGDLYGVEIHLITDQTRLTRESYRNSWFADKAQSGGGHLAWLGIHWLDLAMQLSGRDIDAVTGFAGNVGGQPVDIEDSAALALRLEGGIFATMTSGYYLDRGNHSHIRLWGSQGWIEYCAWLGGRHDQPLTWYSTNPDTRTEGIATFDGPVEPRGYTPYVRECVLACAGQQAPPITPRESLRAVNTVFTAYRAAEAGKVLEVPIPKRNAASW